MGHPVQSCSRQAELSARPWSPDSMATWGRSAAFAASFCAIPSSASMPSTKRSRWSRWAGPGARSSSRRCADHGWSRRVVFSGIQHTVAITYLAAAARESARARDRLQYGGYARGPGLASRPLPPGTLVELGVPQPTRAQCAVAGWNDVARPTTAGERDLPRWPRPEWAYRACPGRRSPISDRDWPKARPQRRMPPLPTWRLAMAPSWLSMPSSRKSAPWSWRCSCARFL